MICQTAKVCTCRIVVSARRRCYGLKPFVAHACQAIAHGASNTPSASTNASQNHKRTQPQRHMQHATCSDSASAPNGNLSSRQSGKQPAKHKHRPARGRSTTPPQAITAALHQASTLSRVQHLVQRHIHELNHIHVSTILSKIVGFSQADPSSWYGPAKPTARPRMARPSSHAGQPATKANGSRHGVPQDSSRHTNAGLYSGVEDCEDAHQSFQSSDCDTASEHSGRQHKSVSAAPSSSGRLQDQEMHFWSMGHDRAAAARQLLLLTQRLAHIACEGHSMQYDLDTAACTLVCLVQLGFSDSKRMQQLLEATQPVINQVAAQSATPAAHAGGTLLTEKLQKVQHEAAVSAEETSCGEQLQQWQQSANVYTPIVQMVSACTAMRMKPSAAWLQAVEDATLHGLHHMHVSELNALLIGFRAAGHQPGPSWIASCCTAAVANLPTAGPAEAAMLIVSMCHAMQSGPDGALVEQLAGAAEPLLSKLDTAGLANILSALAALNHRPTDSWMSSFYSAVYALSQQRAGTTGLNVEQLGLIMSALSHLNLRPDSCWLDGCLMGCRGGLPSAEIQHLSCLIDGLCRLGFRAPEAWLQHFLSAAFTRLPFASPAQCCVMVCALARLGHVPQHLWLEELAARTKHRLVCFSSEQLSEMVHSLAQLGFYPGSEWLVEWELRSGGQLEGSSCEELASIAWALAEMGHQPQVSWLYSFILAVHTQMDSFDAGQLTAVFEALPHLSPYPMSSDELVQICASQSSIAVRSQVAMGQEEQLHVEDMVAASRMSCHAGAPEEVEELMGELVVAGQMMSQAWAWEYMDEVTEAAEKQGMCLSDGGVQQQQLEAAAVLTCSNVSQQEQQQSTVEQAVEGPALVALGAAAEGVDAPIATPAKPAAPSFAQQIDPNCPLLSMRDDLERPDFQKAILLQRQRAAQRNSSSAGGFDMKGAMPAPG